MYSGSIPKSGTWEGVGQTRRKSPTCFGGHFSKGRDTNMEKATGTFAKLAMRDKERARQLLNRRILFVQYTDPSAYPPLEHSSRFLANRGWDVVMLGIRAIGTDKFRFLVHPHIRIKQIGFVRGGWQQKLHYLFFAYWTLYWAWRWKPQWVYASDPLACPGVWLAQKLTNVRVVYHEHDSPDRN